MTDFRTPRPLTTADRTSGFTCGNDDLDRWLRGYAKRNQRTGASRTMVSVTNDGEVAGFYCLSASSLVRDSAPGALAAGQPDPIPVVLLGRLAVDVRFHGSGLGGDLLHHAVLKAIEAADAVGMRAITVKAISEAVVPFYERFGFTRFPGTDLTLYLLLKDARATIDSL